MLFILIMDVLNSLIRFAIQQQLLQPLAVQQTAHRASFYADDAVIFLRPTSNDLRVMKFILDLFGQASGLHTNLSKSSASPIHYSTEDLQRTTEVLACSILNFPCQYLGLPLTIRKPSKEILLPLIEKVADHLPGWKASLLNRAGRLVLTRGVLTATSTYTMIALDLPRWVIKAIDKKRRGFLWKGQEKANGGNCLVSWDKVQWPLEYGGLGIHNLEVFGWALRIRWLWAQKTDPNRPWAGLPIQVPAKAKALFDMAIDAVVGDGESILFWTDRWLNGGTLAELAPNVFRTVPKRVRKSRTIAQALQNRGWVQDIRGALTVQVLMEYLQVWDLMDGVILQQGVPDQFRWKLSQSGSYSSKTAYAACFVGSIRFPPWKRIWKSWAPLRCKFFLWLAIKQRIWTADCLAKRGLPHQAACPLCDQEHETARHLLLTCVFTRQCWSLISQHLNLVIAGPATSTTSFSAWWSLTIKSVPKDRRRGLNSLIILVTWEIWKHRNACVFEGARPSVQLLLQTVSSECALWCMAGASKLKELLDRSMPLAP